MATTYEKKNKQYYREGVVENIDYVVCQLCQHRYGFLAHHLAHKHHVNSAEYLIQFPNALIASEVYRERLSRSVSAGIVSGKQKWKTRKVKLNKRFVLGQFPKEEMYVPS